MLSNILFVDKAKSYENSREIVKAQKVECCTASFYPMKYMGTRNCRVPAGKTCTIYGKELYESQRNFMYVVDINPVTYTDCGETP